jgi:hypothetical protein
MRHAGDGRMFIVCAAVLMAGLVIATMLTINARLESALYPHAASGRDPSLKVLPVTPAPPLQVIAAPSVAPVTATVVESPLPDPGTILPAPAGARPKPVILTPPTGSSARGGREARGNGAAGRPAGTPAPVAAPAASQAAPVPIPVSSAPPVAAPSPVAAVRGPQSDIGDPAASRGEVNGGIRGRQDGSPQFSRAGAPATATPVPVPATPTVLGKVESRNENRSDEGRHHCDREGRR